MKNLHISSALRNVKLRFGSFIAVLLVIALGASLFAGVKAAQLDMLKSADKYYNDNKLMDVKLTSVNGFSDDDINLIKEQFECTAVPSYYVENAVSVGKTNFTASFTSYTQAVNVLTLTKGRLPKSAGECVASADSRLTKLKIGDEVIVNEEGTGLKTKKLKVVGLYKSPLYLSGESFGKSEAEGKKIGNALYVTEDAFSMTRANQLYLRMGFLRESNCYTTTYNQSVKSVIERIEALSKVQLETIKDGDIDLRHIGLENISAEMKVKLDNVYAVYDEVVKQQEELNKIKKDIDELGIKLEAAYAEYNFASSEADRGENENKKAEEEYKKGVEAVTNKEAELTALKLEISTKASERDAAKIAYDTAAEELKLLEEGTDEHTAKKTAVETLKADLDAKNAAVEELEKKATQMQTEIDSMKAQYQSKFDSVKESLKPLLESEIKSEEHYKEMDKLYNQAMSEYEIKKGSYLEQANAVSEQLIEIRIAIYTILSEHKTLWKGSDRNILPDYKSIPEKAASLGLFGLSDSKTFPLILFIAALVCVAPLIVFVNKQSAQIGLMKAMGISSVAVWLRFVLFSVLATVIGCVVGCCIGFEVVSPMIINSADSVYGITAAVSGFSASALFVALTITLVCTTLTVTLLCCFKLRKQPAQLINKPHSVKDNETENADID